MLFIENRSDIEVEIGKIGKRRFKKGFYAYVGSALSGIEGRIRRHLKKQKKLYWHIDYFLTMADAEIKEVVFAETEQKKECKIAMNLAAADMDMIKNFGCSDCFCGSHLFFSTDATKLKSCIYRSFVECGLRPRIFSQQE
ncbi:MAG: GIY-YIG nuclease family protein [Candidatus Methanospirareceae archaeon]